MDCDQDRCKVKATKAGIADRKCGVATQTKRKMSNQESQVALQSSCRRGSGARRISTKSVR
jgi:hypothetical protein